MSSFEIISDYSKANLHDIPEHILEMSNLKMLFLERNMLVKLPENFFYRLPNLMWLDVRNNQLEELPTSIAHHEHLEHLLLTNNNIKRLPNELGLVTNLKALQVAENPLVYPPKNVLQQGTKLIKKFLKEEYEKECEKNVQKQKESELARQEINRQRIKELQKEWETMNGDLERQRVLEMQEEQLLQIHDHLSDVLSYTQSINRVPKEINVNKVVKGESRELSTNRMPNKTIEYLQNKLSNPNILSPSLRVKKIEPPNQKPEEPIKIVHKVDKTESKIFLKSYFTKRGTKNSLERIPENVLKEGWLNKLRILLNDQERILQQERNLKALSSWRQKKPSTPKTFGDIDSSTRKTETPYATYPEYSRMPSRDELAAQLQAFLTDTNVNATRSMQTSHVNLDMVINDLMQQLKGLETHTRNSRSPRSEMENAGQQIQTIVDIHKKLLQLKTSSDFY